MLLKPADVQRSLNTIRNRLDPILDGRSHSVLAKAEASLDHSIRQHRIRQRPWGIQIDPDDPLVFKETEVDDLKLQVDLFLRCFWNAEPAEVPHELNVAMRVWSLDEAVYYRTEWDSEGLKEKLESGGKRVMLRLHFDLANPNQPGPRYHLQVGGVQHTGEHHWFPENLSVPRMLHFPVDLILATELIAATFYPCEYRKIRRESLWVNSRRVSQEHLLTNHLNQALGAINKGSVMECLWNVKWE